MITASTIRSDLAERRPSMKPCHCVEAPRDSDGVLCRYLPVRMPRPSGDQASTPSPSDSAAGTTSRSTPRCSSEYSTCVETSGVRPGQALCQVAACAVCQPVKLLTPT